MIILLYFDWVGGFKELKEWAHDRTRPATFDSRRIDYFSLWAEAEASEEAG